MTTATVVDQRGQPAGVRELPSPVFEVAVNDAVLHQALVRQLANARQGTHETKTRSQVRGGGKKPYRQKGTGRARQGSIRAPHYEGGGTVFGPHNRSYRLDMPRKQRRLALRSALSAKAKDGAITILGDVQLEAPRTKAVVELLDAIGADGRVLLVLATHNEVLERSARNIPEVRTTLASNLSVRDVLTADTVLMTGDAVDHVVEAWS